MKSSRSNDWAWVRLLLGALVLGLLAGCIADSAEDSDLPWSTNQNWEGLGPAGSLMNNDR